MYKLDILTINEDANYKFFTSWLKENYRPNYVGASFGFKVVLNFESEPTQSEKTDMINFYTSLTVNDVVPDLDILAVYEQMKIDGKKYFFEAKAKYFGKKYKDGDLTDENIDYIYTRLERPERRLNHGDWMPALYYMQNKMGSINQTDIDNGYTQEIHDEIIQDLTNYLNQ
jgi:hypothetical protein